jgi:hypothetical protein
MRRKLLAALNAARHQAAGYILNANVIAGRILESRVQPKLNDPDGDREPVLSYGAIDRIGAGTKRSLK